MASKRGRPEKPQLPPFYYRFPCLAGRPARRSFSAGDVEARRPGGAEGALHAESRSLGAAPARAARPEGTATAAASELEKLAHAVELIWAWVGRQGGAAGPDVSFAATSQSIKS